MKILILEDNDQRQKQFKDNLIDHDILITDSSKIAIEKLKKEKWDYLFLDHDLGNEVLVPSGENTGYEVAKFLEENKQFIPNKVIIHSLNFEGARKMLFALPNAEYIPFGWTIVNLKKIGF